LGLSDFVLPAICTLKGFVDPVVFFVDSGPHVVKKTVSRDGSGTLAEALYRLFRLPSALALRRRTSIMSHSHTCHMCMHMHMYMCMCMCRRELREFSF